VTERIPHPAPTADYSVGVGREEGRGFKKKGREAREGGRE